MAEELSLEEQKKLILPFMQRAQEIEKADPKVAYYCRMYAVEQALTIPKRAKEVNSLISATISKLEKDKVALGIDKDQDKVHCEAFALRVFANADKADRMGKADAGTARGFYAASCFIDILNQFSPLDADMTGKQKYALWRAAEIRKAIREGRPPVPPPGTDEVPASALSDSQPQSPTAAGSSFLPAVARPAESSAASWSAPAPSLPSPPEAPPSFSSAPSFPSTSHPSYPSAGAPPGLAPPPPPLVQPSSGSATTYPGQRYKPGSPVLFCQSMGIGSSVQEKGTIGQVALGPDGQFSYKVALKDRLVQANDMQVAPFPPEGTYVSYTEVPGQPPLKAQVTMVTDGMGWPPTYFLALPNRQEITAQAHELSMLLPEESAPQRPATNGLPGTPDLSPHASVSSTTSGSAYPTMGSNAHAPPPPLPPPPASSWTPPPPAAPAPTGPRPASSWQPVQPTPPQQPPAYTPGPPPQAPPGYVTIPMLPPGHKPSVQAITEAQKAARTAVSSLNFEDAAAAIKYLTYAVQLLTTPAGQKLPQMSHK